jgi:hypothetical protein
VAVVRCNVQYHGGDGGETTQGTDKVGSQNLSLRQ